MAPEYILKHSTVISCLQNDLYCVGRGVTLYSVAYQLVIGCRVTAGTAWRRAVCLWRWVAFGNGWKTNMRWMCSRPWSGFAFIGRSSLLAWSAFVVGSMLWNSSENERNINVQQNKVQIANENSESHFWSVSLRGERGRYLKFSCKWYVVSLSNQQFVFNIGQPGVTSRCARVDLCGGLSWKRQRLGQAINLYVFETFKADPKSTSCIACRQPVANPQRSSAGSAL